jgi:hypothetical protein
VPMDLATAEQAVLNRVGSVLTKVGIDPGLVSPMPGLQDPIGFGLANSGYPPADPTVVTDDDFTSLLPAKWYQVIDLAVLRLTELVALNWSLMYEQEKYPDQTWVRNMEALLRTLDTMRKYAQIAYGLGVPVIGSGSVKTVALDPQRYLYPGVPGFPSRYY